MRGDGRNARVAKTVEEAKAIIGWRCTEEKVVRGVVPTGTTRADIKEESGGGECIGPEPRRDVSMKKKGADTVIKGSEDALGATILLGGVGTG